MSDDMPELSESGHTATLPDPRTSGKRILLLYLLLKATFQGYHSRQVTVCQPDQPLSAMPRSANRISLY